MSVVEDVDADKKSSEEAGEEKEENYFVWEAKQLECLKLPIFRAPPRSSSRALSSERKAAKSSRSTFYPSTEANSDQSDDSQKEDNQSQTGKNKLNQSTYSITPLKDDEEEEDPLMTHRKQYFIEKEARRHRWIVKEADRITESVKMAALRANSTRACTKDSLRNTDNMIKAYNSAIENLNSTCLTKLK